MGGRTFTVHDNPGSERVVMVSKAFIDKFWAGDVDENNPYRTQLLFPDAPENRWRIVGVVGDIHANGLSNKPPPMVYFPIAQAPDELTQYVVSSNPIAWIVRIREDSLGLRSAIRTQLPRAIDGLPMTNIRSMNEILSRSISGREFNMFLLIFFSASALALATLGIFGLISYSVKQRTHEIGIRIALGAEPANVRAMVVLEGFRLILFGVAVGMLSSWALTHSLDSFLFSSKRHDVPALIATPIFISAIALIASWIPARTASRLDPIHALRHE
jgi:hypothetical protein